MVRKITVVHCSVDIMNGRKKTYMCAYMHLQVLLHSVGIHRIPEHHSQSH